MSTLKINIKNTTNITIGRKPDNDIVLMDKKVSGAHCVLINKGYDFYVRDFDSTNGTFIDGLRVDGTAKLDEGAVLRIQNFELTLKGNDLLISGDGSKIVSKLYTGNAPGRSADPKQENPKPEHNNIRRNTGDKHEWQKRPDMPYPYFKRSPRLIERIPGGETEIEAAPDTMTKPEINWVSVILSSLGSVLIMALIPVVASLLNMPVASNSMWLLMLPMAVMGPLTATVNYNSQKKKYKNEQDRLYEKYTNYIAGKRKELEQAAQEQKEISLRNDPDLNTVLDCVKKRGPELFARTMNDEDALSVRLGEYSAPLSKEIRIPRETFAGAGKNYTYAPKQLKDEFSEVDGIPFCISLKEHQLIGVSGGYKQASALIRALIMHLTFHHGYDDVRLVMVFDKNKSAEWAWTKWLPHVNDETGARYIVCDSYDIEALKPVIDELDYRRQATPSLSMAAATMPSPFYLFVLIDPAVLNGHKIIKYLQPEAVGNGVGTIVYSPDVRNLPNTVTAVIEAHGNTSVYYEKNNANDKTVFSQDSPTSDMCDRYARAIAPIRLGSSTIKASLPTYVSFLEGYGLSRVEDFDIGDFWRNSRPERTMSVPIGINSHGERFCFDIHERDTKYNPEAHGPHGMVTGMTGSGKTEMIQTWILSMALQFSPRDVSFVLIDFKGTGLIQPFLDLPHLAGSISDLDTDISRNLIALRSELKRREMLLAQTGFEKIGSYMRAFREGEVKEPLGYLFIVIDEYAEFKKTFPDFTREVDSLFQRGRSLGVHVIVMAQNPTGIVTAQTQSNINFRWCLKVADKELSKEAIPGHEEAARLTNPGRAYIQVGADEVFELVQSFYSGADYVPNAAQMHRQALSVVYEVDLKGNRSVVSAAHSGRSGVSSVSKGKEIDEIVRYISMYAKSSGTGSARKIWAQKLPAVIALPAVIERYGRYENADELAPVVGVLDDPSSQKQYPLYVPLSEMGHTVVFGAPGSGKTTFLQTLVYSICCTYTPDEVNLYLLDFGSWSFGMFSDFPHVGDISFDNDEEKIMRIIELIGDILDERKSLFAGMGVGSIQAFNRSSQEKIPYAVLVIDNFVPVLQLFPQFEQFFVRLSREGGSYGVILVTCVNGTSGLGFRIQQNIKTNIALQLNDIADYSSVIGRTEGLYPEPHVGRGLYRGGHVMEFQTAIPEDSTDDNERTGLIKAEGRRQRTEWKGTVADAVKTMPDIIYPEADNEPGRIMIGLDMKLSKLCIDLTEPYTLLISGTGGSGRTNMLRAVIMQLKDDTTDIRVYGNQEEFGDLSYGKMQIYSDGAELDGYLEALAGELKRRKESKASGEVILSGKILLVIDDLGKCYKEISDLSANRLNAAVRMGQDLELMIVAAGDRDELNRYKGMIPFIDYMAEQQIIIMGGCPGEHLISDLGIPTAERNVKMDTYEAMYVDKEHSVRFRAVYGGSDD